MRHILTPKTSVNMHVSEGIQQVCRLPLCLTATGCSRSLGGCGTGLLVMCPGLSVRYRIIGIRQVAVDVRVVLNGLRTRLRVQLRGDSSPKYNHRSLDQLKTAWSGHFCSWRNFTVPAPHIIQFGKHQISPSQSPSAPPTELLTAKPNDIKTHPFACL